jgi:tripartite ATP-independent transporter DctP family solute receptor
MHIMKKCSVLIIAFSLLLLSACGGGGAGTSTGNSTGNSGGTENQKTEDPGKTYNFKMTHITQTSHVWHMFAEKLAEELNTRSNGRMKMEIYPSGQLGPEKDMVQQLETGSIDFALITVPYLSSRVPELTAWNMPFMFPTLEDSVVAIQSEPAQKMLGLLESQGILGKGYMFAGNHQLLMKDTPVKSAADIKGKKIRVTGGPAVLDFFTAAGASPVAMGLTEVYSALQTGVMDGVSVDASGLITEKFYEIADYFVLTNHMAFPGIIVASKVVYDGMPAEDQKIVDEAIKGASEWGLQELLRLDKENTEKLKEHLTVMELEDRESFYQARDEIYAKYMDNELIKEFIEANMK